MKVTLQKNFRRFKKGPPIDVHNETAKFLKAKGYLDIPEKKKNPKKLRNNGPNDRHH